MTFPQSITRKQTREALAVLGIDPHDVRDIYIGKHEVRMHRPYRRLDEGVAVEEPTIVIPLEGL